LTSANVVILFDLDFNPHNDAQAEDRAHRVGQTRDVTVIKLIMKDSVEEHILNCAQRKLKLDRTISSNTEVDQCSNENDNGMSTLSLPLFISPHGNINFNFSLFVKFFLFLDESKTVMELLRNEWAD